MVAFVLNHPRMEAFDAAIDGIAARIEAGVPEGADARHPSAQPRHAEATLPVFLFRVAQGLQDRIDQHRARYRWRFRIPRDRFAGPENHHPERNADLGRCQPGALGRLHGVVHILDEGRKFLGAESRHRLGALQQARIAHSEDLADGHRRPSGR